MSILKFRSQDLFLFSSVGYSGGGVVKLDLRTKDKNKLDKLPGTIELLLGKYRVFIAMDTKVNA